MVSALLRSVKKKQPSNSRKFAIYQNTSIIHAICIFLTWVLATELWLGQEYLIYDE